MSTFRGRKLGRQLAGKPISAAFLNDVASAAERAVVGGAHTSSASIDGRDVVSALPRDGKLVRTPVGGIPAASYSSGTLTPGSAECELFTPTEKGWSLSGDDVTVYNTVATAVSGNSNIQVKLLDGRLVVDVVPC